MLIEGLNKLPMPRGIHVGRRCWQHTVSFSKFRFRDDAKANSFDPQPFPPRQGYSFFKPEPRREIRLVVKGEDLPELRVLESYRYGHLEMEYPQIDVVLYGVEGLVSIVIPKALIYLHSLTDGTIPPDRINLARMMRLDFNVVLLFSAFVVNMEAKSV